MEKVKQVESVQEWWEETSLTMLRVGQDVLSIRAGRTPPGDKDTWWWNDKVQEVITAQTEARKMWETSGRQEDIYSYRQDIKTVKKAVATAKVRAMNVLYEELETPEGERNLG